MGTEIPPPLGKIERGWKSGKLIPKLLLPQWIFHPCICLPLKTNLPKRPRAPVVYLSAWSPSENACMLTRSSPVWLFVTPWTVACRLLCPPDSPGKSTRVGFHALLQDVFLMQALNLRLFCRLCRQAGRLSPTQEPSESMCMSLLSIHFLSFLNLFACLQILSWWRKNLKFTSNKTTRVGISNKKKTKNFGNKKACRQMVTNTLEKT